MSPACSPCTSMTRSRSDSTRSNADGKLTDSAAGLEGATLLTLATGTSGHVVSPSVGVGWPLPFGFVGVCEIAEVESAGAAKAASSARGSRFSTIRLSVTSLARADRAWRIEYCASVLQCGRGWRNLRHRYLLLDSLLDRSMRCLSRHCAMHQSSARSDGRICVTVVKTPCNRSWSSDLVHSPWRCLTLEPWDVQFPAQFPFYAASTP